MTMDSLEIPLEFKADIELYQNQLKNGIRNHQLLYQKLKENPHNTDLHKSLREWEDRILAIGLEQKKVFDRLRKEYKNCQKNSKKTVVRNGIEERRANVTNSFGRARKQNIVTRPTSVASSTSEESENVSEVSSPELIVKPIQPHDDLQNRRVERKRRSTTNPSFVYTKEWNAANMIAVVKRKRSSPPNTRSSAKTKKTSPPPRKHKSRSPSPEKRNLMSSFPVIPNLPSGLTIERVSPVKPGDMSKCIECNLPGALAECENCRHGFHVSCHNRILAQSPKYCPRCHSSKDINSPLGTPNSMSVTCLPTDTSEKLQEKKILLEQNKTLTAELTQLQDQHSQLTISLRNQKHQREELLMTQQSTEEKIEQILNFISSIKSPLQEDVEIDCS